MAKRGRTPKLDEAKREQLIMFVQLGNSIATAAAAVGCSARTVYNTANRDPAFALSLREAGVLLERSLVDRIKAAAEEPKYWRAAAWMLERLNRDRFGNYAPDSVPGAEMTDNVVKACTIIFDEIRDEETFQRICLKFGDLENEATYKIDSQIKFALECISQENDWETAKSEASQCRREIVLRSGATAEEAQ